MGPSSGGTKIAALATYALEIGRQPVRIFPGKNRRKPFSDDVRPRRGPGRPPTELQVRPVSVQERNWESLTREYIHTETELPERTLIPALEISEERRYIQRTRNSDDLRETLVVVTIERSHLKSDCK